jgi:hypothetical protein
MALLWEASSAAGRRSRLVIAVAITGRFLVNIVASALAVTSSSGQADTRQFKTPKPLLAPG